MPPHTQTTEFTGLEADFAHLILSKLSVKALKKTTEVFVSDLKRKKHETKYKQHESVSINFEEITKLKLLMSSEFM